MSIVYPVASPAFEAHLEPFRPLQADVGPLLILVVIGIIIWFLVQWAKSASQTGNRRNLHEEPTTPSPPSRRHQEPSASSGPSQRDSSSRRVEEPPPVPPHSAERFAQPAQAPRGVSRPASMAARWVPPGQAVTIAGYTIPGGMIYVGDSLAAAAGYGQEPALIQPSLPVDSRSPNRTGVGLNYWPSYDSILAPGRAAYLEWLANGRKDPASNIGYVFLFFYGLERRLLHDLPRDATVRDELPAIRAEVVRLRQIYPANGSFQGYTAGFLDMCQALETVTSTMPREAPQGPERTFGVPLVVKLALGRLALEGRPIPADWALAWTWNDPETGLRTPAQRCPAEVRALFLARYPEVFPGGLILKPNKTPLSVRYGPASASFSRQREWQFSLGDVPDITAQRAAAGKLRALLEQCTGQLDPYSRWLGRSEEGSPALPGLALLPAEVLALRNLPEVEVLRSWAEGQVGGAESSIMKATDLLARWPLANPAKPSRTEIIGLAQLLQKLNFGIEPDPRFEGPVIAPDDRAVLFRLKWPSPQAATPEYAAAALLLRMAASIAAADEVSREEEELLCGHLETSLKLAPQERTRLAAHMRWLLSDPPGLSGLKKRIEQLGPMQRSKVADFLVAVAGADGKITKAEVSALTKAFTALGVDPNEVYSRIHVFTAGVPSGIAAPALAEPVTVQAASPETGFRIPAPPREKDGQPDEFTLDMKRVEAKMAESIAVSTLLSEIFVEQEEVPAPPVSTWTGGTTLGLDASHTAALRELLGRQTWSRMEWERLCAQHGLMPDGALEAINDAVFECHDAALVEGDDPFEVNMDVAKEIE